MYFLDDHLQLGPQLSSCSRFIQVVLKIAIDNENLSNLLYLILTITAYYNYIFYSFLLLDIVKRNEDL